MFESYQEAERNSGFKGFMARHFGPVIYADTAEEGIRQIGIVFMVAAVILLVLSLANALLSLPALLPWVWVLFSVRAMQLTFGYHRLRRTRTEVLSAME